MMTSLFSVFDPTFSTLIPGWSSTIMILMFLPSKYWLINSRLNLIFIKVMKTLHKEFKTLMIQMYPSGASSIMYSLLILIFFNNFMGLFPYIFTSSSHILMTLSLALPLWLSFILYGMINNTKHMMAHLVPQGTPMPLMSFMVCIESISNLIRPITLSIRLAANMIAGHLLLTLLSSQGPNMLKSILIMLISSQILLLLLESAVSIIQSYVFTILSVLYSSEVD